MKMINLLLLSLISFVGAYAQKLPNVQQVSVRAPANVKIDGKPDEWGAQYQAYNNVTGVFYSMANDDENLFLVIYSNNQDITTKILTNGIDVCFNTKKKSTDKGLFIKYPIGPKTRGEILERSNAIKAKLNGQDRDVLTGSGRLMRNKAIVAVNKQVGIMGAPAFTDTLFSIYDAKGVAVGLACPEEDIVCYELLVPLKHLGISASSKTKINYNIRLNEHFLSHVLPPDSYGDKMPGGNDEGLMLLATDFWGEYTLAK